MDRAARLEKQFDAIIKGKQSLTPLNGPNFIDAILAQSDASTCIARLMSSKAGLSSLQTCMRWDLTPHFFNGRGSSILIYLQDPNLAMINSGVYLNQIIQAIVEPPIFWLAYVKEFRAGRLQGEQAQVAFAWLLLHVTSISIQPGAPLHSEVAHEEDIMHLIISSPHASVRDLGGRISSIMSVGDECDIINTASFTAGGRHDNDFADFRRISILPTAAEVRCKDRPFLRLKSCLDDPETEAKRTQIYLDNEFRLLREDMLHEMKEELLIAEGEKKGYRKGVIIDGLQLHNIHFGPEAKRANWGIALKCEKDLTILTRKRTLQDRETFLKENFSKPFRHQAWSCLIVDGEITAYPTLNRDEDFLALNPPILILQIVDSQTEHTLSKLKVARHIRLIILETAVFSFEPILKVMQGIKELSLSPELLHWTELSRHKTPDNIPPSLIQTLREKHGSDLQSSLRTQKPIVLDRSQHTSLLAALTQRVSLIQGPPRPGTGKSFIGALLAKIIHDHTPQTILVVCYTNHALDQFLEDLLNIGIPDEHIVRLGGKSTPRTAPLGLAGRSRKSNVRLKQTNYALIDLLKADAEHHIKTLKKKFNQYKYFKTGLKAVLEYLEFEHPDTYAAFRIPAGDDGMTQVGRNGQRIDEIYLIKRWIENKNAGIYHQKRGISGAPAWALSQNERHSLLAGWKQAMMNELIVDFSGSAARYNNSLKQLADIFAEKDDDIVSRMRIIGCTTTAAAKYSEQIQKASPQVLLVEEAGEILESHILTAMNPQTSQLILIGDHQQLRPKVNSYSLTVEKGDGYNLNMSLFERLVIKGFPHETLSEQHRMRPEISSLIRELTYPHLVDAPRTKNRSLLRGIQDVIIFLNHSHPEDDNPQIVEKRDMNATSSKQNTHEVEMVLKILRYLAQQGYGTDKVTILTPYLGQLQKLRTALMEDNDPVLSDMDSYDLVRAGLVTPASAKAGKKSIRLATIDNYQGEESDIIIASLTRSNPDHNIGFMCAPERLNVLLSRARDGLILIGNSDTFTKSHRGGKLWSKFLDILKRGGHVYDGLPAFCERHPDRKSLLKSPLDFDNEVPDGGCREPCGTRLSCGIHDCPSRCHQLADHSKMPCEAIVQSMCPQGHKQSRKCQLPPQTCRKCDREAEEARKKQQKAFAEQQRHDAEQLAHAKAMAELDEKIAEENRKTQDAQLRKERQDALEQKKKDLEGARLRNERKSLFSSQSGVSHPSPAHIQTTPPSQSQIQDTGKTDSGNPGTDTSSRPHLPVTSLTTRSTKISPSEAEWQRQKDVEGADNKAIDSLMKMTGLEEVKVQVLDIKAKIDLNTRQSASLKNERFNVVMLGNPGTGKTTVARLYAKFLSSVGVLPGDHFIETTGSRLGDGGVAGIKKHIEDVIKAGGGAIFVDEAYQLVSGESMHGKEVLNFMLAEMENNVGKLVFILAGYRKAMEKFFEHNPGLPSRVPYQLHFKDYTDEELGFMLRSLVVERYQGLMKVEDGIDGLYARIAIRRLGRGRGKEGFGNARALENMFAKVTERQAARIQKARAAGQKPDDLLLLGEDLIGPKPTDVLANNASWKKLKSMIGLKSVKDSVQIFFDLISTNYNRELQEKQPLQVSLNRVFTGSPGTGKTTVAKLYGQILADLGLLSNGEVVLKNPADFVGSHLGQSESNTKAILASTVGKVLAYMLYGRNKRDGSNADPYKTAVIDTIVAEVQSVPGEDRCVLLLGYREQIMEMFLNVNPGLSRRFDIENAFQFDDFSDPELRDVLELKMKQGDLEATDAAKGVAIDVLSRARNRPNFGNGGEVENVLSRAKVRFQKRQAQLPISQRALDIILEPQDFDEDYNRQSNAATNLEKLFEDVVGCEDIVKKLGNWQKVATQMRLRGREPREQIPMCFIFKGPPGTGKTTTARKMGKVYYDMGFLSSTEVYECSASDLIGQYVGSTGPLVKAVFEKALGRVLFIDEAYRLGDGHFAQEAVDEIVSLMTQERYMSKLIIILAGYDNDMNQLLSVNSGLSSRFPEEIIFRNMDPGHCLEVLGRLLQKTSVIVKALSDHSSVEYAEMHSIIQRLSEIPSWGNIRDIVTLSKQVITLAFQNADSSASSDLIVSGSDTITLFKSMLTDRQARHGPSNVSMTRRQTGMPTQPMPPHMLSAPPPPQISTSNYPTSMKLVEVIPPVQTDSSEDADRDPGVSDEIWRQLQLNKAAMVAEKQREREAARQLEEAREREEEVRKLAEELEREQARIAARKREEDQARIRGLKARAEATRLEELRAKAERERFDAIRKAYEEQQKKEAKAQQKLREMGVCVAGYHWIPERNGYRCAGGSHFVSKGQLGL
uniref:AAA+ ATPase domain-containing protein n=1 Tax=Moniliophthora roreri TaxID=221103 RepID=A0A0W0EUT7_MONRR